jgi:uncharacterized protein (DUF433 family)
MEATAKTEPWRPDLSQVRLEDLPADYQELAHEDVLGIEGALALIRTRGGRKLTIPARRRDEHPLAAEIGARNWARLLHHYRGQRINVPSVTVVSRPARNRLIQQAHRAGMTVDEIIRRFGLAERRIQQIITGDRA